ncbi:MAG: DUF4013 domain-containing protein [Haloquadratum sp.]
MIQESLQYPRNDDQWIKTVLIGGVLSLLGIFIVPTFFVLGYFLRVIRRTMHGDEQPPVFDDWGDLLSDGLKAFVVVFVYGLIPGVVGAVFIGGGVLSMAAGGNADAGSLVGFGLVGVLLGSLLALVLGLLAAYVVPAAMAVLAETDRLGASFSIGELRPVLGSGTYATAWLSGFAIIVGAGLIAGALNVVPLLGSIVGVFLSFYAAVAAYYIIGRAWGELRDVEVRDRDDTPDEQAAV